MRTDFCLERYIFVLSILQGRVSSTGRLAVFYEKQSTSRSAPMSPTNIVMVAR